MAWSIGLCEKCNYRRPDHGSGTHYCVFRVRARRWSLLRWRWVRYWQWSCDECSSHVQLQARRNKAKRQPP